MSVLRNCIISLAIFCCTKINAQSTDTLSNHYSDVDTLIEDSVVPSKEQHKYNADTSSEKKYIRMYIDEEKLEALKKKKDFQYPDIENDSSYNSEELFKRPAKQKTRTIPAIDGSVLLWIVLGVAIVIIVLQFSGISLRQIFSPASLKQAGLNDGLTENIHDISFDEAISKALADKHFSLAIRLMYFQNLKILADTNRIKWNEHKTNWQYVNELAGTTLQNGLRRTTYIFEYVQYGKVIIEETKFNQLQNIFKQFKESII